MTRAVLLQIIADYPNVIVLCIAAMGLVCIWIDKWRLRRERHRRRVLIWHVIDQMVDVKLWEAKSPSHGGPLIVKPWDATIERLARDTVIHAPNFHVDLRRYDMVDIKAEVLAWQTNYKETEDQREAQANEAIHTRMAERERDVAQDWIEAHDR